MKFPLLNSKFPLYFTFLPKQLSITVPVLALQLELISKLRDFPGGPVVKTSPSSIGDENLIPGQEAKIPQASRPKNQKHQNRSNIWTKSIKIFKMIHIKKILKKITCVCVCSVMSNPSWTVARQAQAQARILEWVAVSFSGGSSWTRNRPHISCISRLLLYHWAIWEIYLKFLLLRTCSISENLRITIRPN